MSSVTMTEHPPELKVLIVFLGDNAGLCGT